LADGRRKLGVFAVLALVLLRLAIGWHFFREGLGKLAYDDATRQYHVAFSAESFLAQAKGPWAKHFRDWAPNVHDWPTLLAVPKQSRATTDDEAAEHAKWLSDHDQRRTTDEAKKGPAAVEFPPFAPYHDWAARVADDWQAILSNLSALPVLNDDQRHRAAEILREREQQLADYLADQSEAISDYQHELWRLDATRATPEASGVPYVEKRIASKAAETTAAAAPWLSQARDFEQKFLEDLRNLLTPEQKSQATTSQAIDAALTSPQQARLQRLNVGLTILTIAVGACLLIGFFTRLASLAGALFLLAIIATQPPWVADAAPTYNQIIELAGLLVLAGTGAGRWLGLDYLTYALFHRHRDLDD
jgi:uncharacterized membrane protein YphA (DoxX/SURF4 family)